MNTLKSHNLHLNYIKIYFSKLFIGIILFLHLGFNPLYSQNQTKLDSLNQKLKTSKIDTVKIQTLIAIGKQYENKNADSTLFYYQKALKIAKKSNNQIFISESFRNIGVVYYYQGNYDKALKYWQKALNINKSINNKLAVLKNLGNIGVAYYRQSNYNKALEYDFKALKIYEELENKEGIATNLGNIGIIYRNQGNYDKALEYDFRALKIYEELKNKEGIATNLGNIGIVYYDQKNYDKALEYYTYALKLYKELNDKRGIVRNLGNIGVVYSNQKNYNKALEYDFKALKIYDELGDKHGIARNLGNIGVIYYEQKKHKESLSYYFKALNIYEEIGNKKGIIINLENIGSVYNTLKQYKKALFYVNKALDIANKIGALNRKKMAYSLLGDIYTNLGKYKKALDYKNKWIKLNNDIFNTQKSEAIAFIQSKYKYDKQKAIDSIATAKQIEIKNIEIKKEKAEKERQQSQRNLFIFAFGLMIIFATFVFHLYHQKRKSNILLNQQKKKIEKNHREISQSIDYATRLQEAVLPEFQIIKEKLSDYFVLFYPKDKVSGDFYWWTQIKKHTIITAADSTGHGVPGAFMSIMGISFLREIVEKKQIIHTGEILQYLRTEIIKALKQKGDTGEQKDGMDMAIISINHETNIVQFSGANNPLYIITNDELQIINEESTSNIKLCDNSKLKIQNSKLLYEVKPDKMPIAIYDKMDTFSTYEIQLKKGDQLYMFSDGFADQFGGPKSKKFKYKPFKRLLLENADKPMAKQKEILIRSFGNWKGNLEQIDDVVVIGIKI